MPVLYVGDDWSEDHHDVALVDEVGRRLARARLDEGVSGITRLHELVAGRLSEGDAPERVVIGIETDRGPWVTALDELAIGFSLGLARLPLIPVIIAIGVQALLAAQLGLSLGARISERLHGRAEQAAAVALILLGGFLNHERLLR